jgi:membrane-associated protein
MIEILSIHFKDLINPEFYIEHGGLWILLFIVFAETGLLAGFFLPGDSLLFVAGIYSDKLAGEVVASGNEFVDLLILLILISVAGILGNFVGYWFGKKSGPFIYHRKDTFFFRKKYLNQAHEFYEKHGGTAIVFARFLPILRTFAPVIAGVVDMDKKKFTYYNIVGSVAWVFSMLIAGHFLQKIILSQFGFDLKEHLEVIVLGIVLVTTLPVLIKIFSRSKRKNSTTQ